MLLRVLIGDDGKTVVDMAADRSMGAAVACITSEVPSKMSNKMNTTSQSSSSVHSE